LATVLMMDIECVQAFIWRSVVARWAWCGPSRCSGCTGKDGRRCRTHLR